MSRGNITSEMAGMADEITLQRVALYLVVLLFVAFFLVPLETGLMTAFKTDTAVTRTIPVVPPGPDGFTLGNLATAFDMLARGFVNSLAMTIPATILDIVFASMAAYGLTMIDWRGQLPILVLFLIGIFIPYQAVLVPLARFWTNIFPMREHIDFLWALPLLKTYHAQLVQLTITHVAYGIPICTLLFRGYYRSLPDSLVEAAKIDGASVTKTYLRIIVPLSTPMFGVVFIYQFTQIWNEFLFALTLVGSANSPAAPITLILSGLGASISGFDFGLRMAGAFLTALPTLLIYVLFAEQFAKGLEGGEAA